MRSELCSKQRLGLINGLAVKPTSRGKERQSWELVPARRGKFCGEANAVFP
jgi:hypothetical protein